VTRQRTSNAKKNEKLECKKECEDEAGADVREHEKRRDKKSRPEVALANKRRNNIASSNVSSEREEERGVKIFKNGKQAKLKLIWRRRRGRRSKGKERRQLRQRNDSFCST
jgi:hypothetical protein